MCFVVCVPSVVLVRSIECVCLLLLADKLCQPVEVVGVVVALLVLPAFGVDVDFQQLGRAFGEEFHRLGSGGQ